MVKPVLTKRDELSFLRVFALPKATNKCEQRKTFNYPVEIKLFKSPSIFSVLLNKNSSVQLYIG